MSYRPESDIQSVRLELYGGYLIYISYQKDGQSNLFLDSIEAKIKRGTLSLCGIPPFTCFWSKDEILNDSWLYSPFFAIIACSMAGLTTFYMFQIYLLVFDGYLNVDFENFNGKKYNSLYSISLWGKDGCFVLKIKFIY
ncbi:hypothetical protein Lal_00040467 [Lupinus albus]|nr:hypothetical protein Lal_00040467 [Lupinus albus]